ncbi:MAG: FAD-binding protein [Rhodanobacteraceae bacterium]|nr:MAG: FAD-binding protein [Rhodanobacteraceae bacterium]
MRRVAQILLVALIVALLVVGWRDGVSLQALKNSRDILLALNAARPLAFAAAFFALYVIATAISLPIAELMTVAAGVLFGLLEGTVLVSFASTLGATLAMLGSRFLFRDWVRRHAGERLRRMEQGVARDGAFYLFSLRLVPAIPFFLINLLAGLMPMKVRTYWWVSQLGMLPATVVYVAAGTQLGHVTSLSGLLSPTLIGALVLIALLPWLTRGGLALLRRRRVYRGWKCPAAFDRNLIVIGAGSAGLVSAYIAATVRAKVTLVEGERMGGDCLNTGCVPSKALIRIARAAHAVRQARCFGIEASAPQVDFAAAMHQVHEAIAAVAPHDSVERFQKLGVDVRRGHAKIVSPWCVEVDGEAITTRAIVIAAGAEPVVPELPGLRGSGFLTSDTIWSLDALPPRLVILGGGPIGCELAQAFARLGSRVTVVQRAARLLMREDDEVSAFVAERLRTDGVDVRTSHAAVAVETGADGKWLRCEHAGESVRFGFDKILVAIGRTPRTRGYGLEELKIPLTPKKTLETDAWLQTLYPNIYACGDVAGPWQLTHAGAHQAWYATVNALFGGIKRFRVDERVMPVVTFTDPEVARVGLNEREAQQRGVAYEASRYDLAELDRALAEQSPEGFVKVLTAPGKDRILGATCVGPHAGEWSAEFVLAMRHRIGLNGILSTVHAYPTFAEANKYAAGNWKKAHAPERILRWLGRWQHWRRHERHAPETASVRELPVHDSLDPDSEKPFT